MAANNWPDGSYVLSRGFKAYIPFGRNSRDYVINSLAIKWISLTCLRYLYAKFNWPYWHGHDSYNQAETRYNGYLESSLLHEQLPSKLLARWYATDTINSRLIFSIFLFDCLKTVFVGFRFLLSLLQLCLKLATISTSLFQSFLQFSARAQLAFLCLDDLLQINENLLWLWSRRGLRTTNT